MPGEKKPVATAHPQEIPQTELEENIRCRAYDLYENRGRENGHDVEDWLQAEAELTFAAVLTSFAKTVAEKMVMT
jgi:hypothetical protein